MHQILRTANPWYRGARSSPGGNAFFKAFIIAALIFFTFKPRPVQRQTPFSMHVRCLGPASALVSVTGGHSSSMMSKCLLAQSSESDNYILPTTKSKVCSRLHPTHPHRHVLCTATSVLVQSLAGPVVVLAAVQLPCQRASNSTQIWQKANYSGVF